MIKNVTKIYIIVHIVGEATTYLMRYTIQPLDGIQDIYHTCLHFVGTKVWSHQVRKFKLTLILSHKHFWSFTSTINRVINKLVK